jgi:hypothetical protein
VRSRRRRKGRSAAAAAGAALRETRAPHTGHWAAAPPSPLGGGGGWARAVEAAADATPGARAGSAPAPRRAGNSPCGSWSVAVAPKPRAARALALRMPPPVGSHLAAALLLAAAFLAAAATAASATSGTDTSPYTLFFVVLLRKFLGFMASCFRKNSMCKGFNCAEGV